jgi:hypothetical protein
MTTHWSLPDALMALVVWAAGVLRFGWNRKETD